MQKFITEPSFWELFPDASFGVIVARNMKTADEVPASTATLLTQLLVAANGMADEHLTSDVISENEVVHIWREAYRKFKTKKGARCSIENLLKRVMKGNPVKSITPSVDIYNVISLKYALPVGGEDIDSFVGDMRLGITDGGDAFRPLGENDDDPTLPGELCYCDDEGAVCRCWNWRDGQRAALSDDSRNAFLIIECVDGARLDDVRAATDELAQLVENCLGATIAKKDIITREHPDMVIVD